MRGNATTAAEALFGRRGRLPEAAPAETPPTFTSGVVLVRLSEVSPEEVAWLWPGRLARGKLTLLVGEPGIGKSFLTLDIAARVSRGVE